MKVIEALCLVFCSVYLVTRPGARTTGEQGKQGPAHMEGSKFGDWEVPLYNWSIGQG